VEPTFRDHYRLIWVFEVSDEFLGVDIDNCRADGDLDDEIVATTTGAIAALPSLPSLRAVARLKTKIDERV
jgi:hypothetical protein